MVEPRGSYRVDLLAFRVVLILIRVLVRIFVSEP